MNKRRTLLIAAAVAALTAGIGHHWAAADRPNASPAQLQKQATHVVVGTARAVYSYDKSDGRWRTTHVVAELVIDTVAKGKGLEKGKVVWVKYWHREWVGGGMMPPSWNGIKGGPKAGEARKVYLKQAADGTFDVVEPNGIMAAKMPAK